jgi:hypothetical protein
MQKKIMSRSNNMFLGEKMIQRLNLRHFVVWITMLLPSTLTLIIWRELGYGEPPLWPIIPAIGLLLILLASYITETLKGLRGYVALMATLFFMGFGGGWTYGFIPWVRSSKIWLSLLTMIPTGFSDLAVHVLRLTPTMIILIASFLKGLDRKSLYLVKGNIGGSVSPSRLLGIKDDISWINMTLRFSGVFGLGTLIFLILSTKPDFGKILTNLGVLPFVLVIAGLNAFNEEFTLRAAPLSLLKDHIDEKTALTVTTIFFSLGHYYGVPYGIIGVALSAFLGWFIGKGILETRGFLLAWFTHFVPDFVIFYFLLGIT